MPVAQRLSHLPVIVDPSHSGGRRDLVLPLSRAAIAVGADGIIIDVHPHPETALCDGPQALIESDLRELASIATHLSPLVGRTLTPAPRLPPLAPTRTGARRLRRWRRRGSTRCAQTAYPCRYRRRALDRLCGIQGNRYRDPPQQLRHGI